MKSSTAFGCLFFCGTLGTAFSQTQISVTNTTVDAVLQGNYNPATFQAATVIDQIASIAPDMAARVSRDTLESYLTKLTSFHNRNSASDTVSATQGIGAARRWVYSKFQEFGVQSGGRLLPSYLQFTQTMCTTTRHRNVFAVLPGRDTTNHSLLIVAGHMDSRCEDNCNVTCKAHGADDDGSGAVVVMELARVLSKYTFNHTLVFLVTTGEEQGKYGAIAFRDWCTSAKVPIQGVQNNDVVGGIICGPSSSPPSCSPSGALDSTHVRVFSTAINFSMNKALGRFIKGQYDQWIKPTAKMPMTITILDPTDRTGRGGDHMPFSEGGIPAIRFTESYENGDGSPTSGRQHNSNDIIGDDTNADGKIDKFYVNFDYLARNVQINAIGLIGGALGPQVPDFTLSEPLPQRYIRVTVTAPTSPVGSYKIAVRNSGNNDFAVAYTLKDSLNFTVPGTVAGRTYYIAMAAVDANGAQSLYSQEKSITAAVDGPTPIIRGKISGAAPRLMTPMVSIDRISFRIQGLTTFMHSQFTLDIVNSRGKVLRSHRWVNGGGDQEITLNRLGIPASLYQILLKKQGKVIDTQALLLTPTE